MTVTTERGVKYDEAGEVKSLNSTDFEFPRNGMIVKWSSYRGSNCRTC